MDDLSLVPPARQASRAELVERIRQLEVALIDCWAWMDGRRQVSGETRCLAWELATRPRQPPPTPPPAQ